MMIKNRKFTLLLVSFPEVVFSKDGFLVPYYLGKLYNLSVSIVFNRNSQSDKLPREYRGVKLHQLRCMGTENGGGFSFKAEWNFFFYILNYAPEIDVLMRINFSYQTMIIGWIYKWRNPKGCFYIKGDGLGLYKALLRDKTHFVTKWKNSVIERMLNYTCSLADKVSIELPDLYDFLKEQKPFKSDDQKLVLMLNGFDEEAFEESKIREISISEKENIILSVGRHGSRQKNTELFLRSLELIDLKNWKVIFIGPIESNGFENELSNFYLKNPHLEEQVLFLGPINDKKILWDWYNKAKIFVHTAVYESYGIVLGEAFRFNNYIVSTDVGIAKYIIEKGMGKLFPQNDHVALSSILQSIIDDKINVYREFELRDIDNKFLSMFNEVAKLKLA